MNLPDDQLTPLLIENKIVDEKTINQLLEKAKEQKISLYQSLVNKDPHYETEIIEAWSKKINLPFVTLSKLFIPEDVLTLVPERIAREQKIISFGRDKELVHLAMVNPEEKGFLQFLERKTGQKIKIYLATQNDVETAIKTYKGNLQQTIDELIKEGGKI